MKKVLLALTAVLALTVAHGQTTFQKTYGGTNVTISFDGGNSVQQTTDGGYVIAGTMANFGAGSGYDIYLVKTNLNGDTLWTKTFGGTNSDYGNSVQQTTDGGYVIAGYTYSFGAGNYANIYLIKTDVNGNSLWSKTVGGLIDDYGNSVKQTTDGGYIIAGYTLNSSAGDADVYLIKTDVNGDTLWSKIFGGTTDNEYGNSVQQTTDGGYVIAGSTRSVGSGIHDVYLIKTDVNGNALWSKTVGGINDDYGNSIQQTTDGGYVIAGYTQSFGAGYYDVYLIKTDVNGNTMWSKTIGGATDDEDGHSVQQTTDGGYIIAGETRSFGAGYYDVYLIKTDVNGNTSWSKTFGGTGGEGGHSVQQTTDGGYIITGTTRSFGAGYSDVYLLKTDVNGNTGCNQNNPNTIVTTPVSIVSNPNTQVSSGGIVGNPATQTGSRGVVTTLCSTVGINESNLTDNFVNIYPNPFYTQTVLQTNKLLRNATLTVYNCFGQTVAQIKNINGQTVTFFRDNLASGLYFVRLTEENKTIAVDKLVIADK